MVKKGNGIKDFFEIKMREFGVPNISLIDLDIKNKKDIANVRNFIFGDNNLVVIGSKHYAYCVKLVRLRYLFDLSLDIKFLSQSMLNYEYIKHKCSLKVVVNLYEDTPNRKSFMGNLVNESLANSTQLLLGVSTAANLESAFPYDLDTVEYNFEVLKLGD